MLLGTWLCITSSAHHLGDCNTLLDSAVKSVGQCKPLISRTRNQKSIIQIRNLQPTLGDTLQWPKDIPQTPSPAISQQVWRAPLWDKTFKQEQWRHSTSKLLQFLYYIKFAYKISWSSTTEDSWLESVGKRKEESFVQRWEEVVKNKIYVKYCKVLMYVKIYTSKMSGFIHC